MFKTGNVPWNRGIKYDADRISTMNLSGIVDFNKGKRLSDEHKANIGLGNKGKRAGKTWDEIFGPERAELFRVAKSEQFKNWANHPWRHPRTTEEKEFISRINKPRGEKHWNWNGGSSRNYAYCTEDSSWPKTRARIYKRDGWICQICGKHCVGREIQCHHISPHVLCEYNGDDNLITLCSKCHGLEEVALIVGASLLPVVVGTYCATRISK